MYFCNTYLFISKPVIHFKVLTLYYHLHIIIVILYFYIFFFWKINYKRHKLEVLKHFCLSPDYNYYYYNSLKSILH